MIGKRKPAAPGLGECGERQVPSGADRRDREPPVLNLRTIAARERRIAAEDTVVTRDLTPALSTIVQVFRRTLYRVS